MPSTSHAGRYRQEPQDTQSACGTAPAYGQDVGAARRVLKADFFPGGWLPRGQIRGRHQAGMSGGNVGLLTGGPGWLGLWQPCSPSMELLLFPTQTLSSMWKEHGDPEMQPGLDLNQARQAWQTGRHLALHTNALRLRRMSFPTTLEKPFSPSISQRPQDPRGCYAPHSYRDWGSTWVNAVSQVVQLQKVKEGSRAGVSPSTGEPQGPSLPTTLTPHGSVCILVLGLVLQAFVCVSVFPAICQLLKGLLFTRNGRYGEDPGNKALALKNHRLVCKKFVSLKQPPYRSEGHYRVS